MRFHSIICTLLVLCATNTPVFSEEKSQAGGNIARVTSGTATRLTGVAPQPPRIIPDYWKKFPAGAKNAITDVPGVNVGQISLLRDQPPTLRTGVTAIVPKSDLRNGNLANTAFPAAVGILNGNGEVTGVSGIQHAGLLNGPIILTNTSSVGIAHQGVWQYFQQFFPGQWMSELPVIAECWDGFFNNLQIQALTQQDVINAIQKADNLFTLQGRIGAGTGMRSFGLHGGIGSASRKIKVDAREYTIGVLVNTNHSRLDDLNPIIKTALETHWNKPLTQVKERDDQDRAKQLSDVHRQGSIIIVIATDLPLDAHALQQVAEHAGLGIAQMGGIMGVTSGDFALAFSTTNAVIMNEQTPNVYPVATIHPKALTPIFQATVEAVVEAQLNALVASHNLI